MTYNSYLGPETGGWRDIAGYNVSTGFGWANDGIRGYERKSCLFKSINILRMFTGGKRACTLLIFSSLLLLL